MSLLCMCVLKLEVIRLVKLNGIILIRFVKNVVFYWLLMVKCGIMLMVKFVFKL